MDYLSAFNYFFRDITDGVSRPWVVQPVKRIVIRGSASYDEKEAGDNIKLKKGLAKLNQLANILHY